MRHTHGVTPSPRQQPASVRRDLPAAVARTRSRTSVGQVFAAVAGFVALAAIGAAIGWGVTKAPTPLGSGNPSPPVSSSPSSPPASPSTPPATPTGSVFSIPDYFATGVTFQQARDELRLNKLGVTLVFLTSGPVGTTVIRTAPPAGTPAAHGVTVKVYVNGTPPMLAVPPTPLVPTVCGDWGKVLASTGFTPVYSPSDGKNLMLAAEDPGSDQTDTVWNQKITLTCTPDGQLPSPPPSGPPSAPPSAPPSTTP